MENSIKIYTLSDPITNEVRYVGKTKFTLNKRLSQHICEKRVSKRTCWIKSITNKGLLPKIELLETCGNENWIDTEKFYISYFKYIGVRLVNATCGGDGITFTKEIRDKISNAHKGKKLTQGHKDKLKGNKNSLGHKQTEEHKSKISNALKGKVVSLDTKLKLSQLKNKKQIAKIDVKSNKVIKVYNSISECCRLNGYCKGNIIKVCKNKIRKDGSKCRTAYGYVWRYVE